ncbi:MAG TPA: PQQ-binding-like beta-propeller repeat protein [Streptosporangiaceae bacterium]|nr:PQQ-binding-like beta-propeller repeat protein [Streptosporangiaceae bacterium]
MTRKFETRNLRLSCTMLAGASALATSLAITGAGSARASDASPLPAHSGSWTLYHGDPAGSGNARAVRSVNVRARAWTSPNLDGHIYGQPLVLGRLVYVATENNTVYALSAATGAVRWSRHIGKPVPASSLACGNITPTVGITGTPVIDPAKHEIFVVADELTGGHPAHVLVGLDTRTGRPMLTRRVDPPGQDPAAILQRTGLTLTRGSVLFGFGGNFGDCSTYRGRLVAVPEAGGTPSFFTVAAASDTSKGAIWMGGAAPAVDGDGNLWVSTGNSTITSPGHPYDNSDGTLELSPSLRLLQYWAPRSWPADNAGDIDFSAVPALLPSGQVVQAGKSGRVFLLDGGHLGGVGGEQARLASACDADVDGGVAVSGMTVFLPCLSGIVAVRASASPPRLRLLWKSGTGGGPPIIAAGLVWTIGQDGNLYGLDPATGKSRKQAHIGVPANHFPTPGVGDGLLLAACAQNVVAFAAAGTGAAHAATQNLRPSTSCNYAAPAPAPPVSKRAIAAVAALALAGLVIIAIVAWVLLRRLSRAR